VSAINFTIDPAIALKLGFLHLTDCRVIMSSDALRKTYDGVANTARERFADTPLGEHPVAGGVRRLFKSAGIDPSRYRPSGEALVRRILKGQGLYHINCIVDINNICSIESLFPLGAYDRERIIGDVTIRLGASDEVYRGIGKEINIAGKLVSADSEGAFGSPIADSDRTMISEDTREVLVLLYAPESTDDSDIRNTLNRFAELAGEHAGAQTGNSGVLSGS
jgi:DNA/RNA-binding domain of Phe-tRNA-synthetase-like protein